MSQANRAVAFTFTTNDQQALAALKRLERGFKGLDVQVDRTRQSGLALGTTMRESLGGLALAAGLGVAVTEFSEAEKVAAKTEAVVRSTGGAANRTAEEIAALSDELGKLAAVDNDVVQNGANVLATFTSISDVNFDRALASSLDMSAALGTDLQSSVMQVGKALNDPIRGMASLRRAGIQFSAEQQNVIRALAETGDVAGAQTVMLEELERQFGGAAEANATALDRVRVAAGDLAETAGGALAPAMELVATTAGGVADVFGMLPVPMQQVIILTGAGAAAWARWGENVGDASGSAKNLLGSMTKLTPAMGAAGGAVAAGTLILLDHVAASERAKANTEELRQAFEDGIDPLEAFGDKLARTLAGADGGFEIDTSNDKLNLYLERTGTTIEDLTKLLTGSQEDWDEWERTMLRQGGASERLAVNVRSLRSAYVDAQSEQDALEENMRTVGDLTQRAADAASDNAGATADANRANRDWLSTTAEQNIKQREHRDLLREVNEETREAQALALSNADAAFAYANAQNNVEDAVMALGAARTEGDPEQVERAEQRLAEAIVDAGEAALRQAEAQAELEGRTIDAGEANHILQTEMRRLREETGSTNTTLDATIYALEQVTKPYVMALDTDPAEERLNRIIYKQAIILAQRREIEGGSGVTPGTTYADGTSTGTIGYTGDLTNYRPPGRPTESSTPRGGNDPALNVTVIAPNLTRMGTERDARVTGEQVGRNVGRILGAAS